ncbi:Serine/threonine-protein kinase tel1 [Neolecta irregularis DAH-3]|uniref:Serine/threonine-protein kinase tel1 n=1 Tax=Neolecta irregularis (strain DAH-3) TaxID=1198029 RepID=A0A1U7LTJ5_NEOID|nr:Serine/threonine-protein kinase tel1 [Neolecta irregularis DAH-3]|eukprot:OLL25990.1 Serine/threonine-protein kinase tel1 [Neolecta irregularis DAH-3]
MTILDVLKHDPLYDWTISPLKLAQIQDRYNVQTGQITDPHVKSANINYPEAERALFTVTKKLTSTLGVEATVNELIQTAQDVEVLAMMFQGWGAWQ